MFLAQPMTKNVFVLAFATLVFFPAAAAAYDPADRTVPATADVLYERDVLPMLREHCRDCHGADEANGGFNFDEPVSFFREADSGDRPVVPRNADASELLVRVKSTHDGDRMPPEGEPLTPQQIDVLARWITSGAIVPESDESQDKSDPSDVQSDHWSFQPIADPPIPEIHRASTDADHARSERGRRGRTATRNAIDRFVEHRRRQQGLQSVGDADPVTFLRRVSYSVTGLPPTTQEKERFLETVGDFGMDLAVEQLVDHLLSRSSYGERWGRHWMDWVRYADTAGDNSDFPIPEAYLYRNYIIDSINQDVPYDRFLTEQLAGDLLPAETEEQRNR